MHYHFTMSLTPGTLKSDNIFVGEGGIAYESMSNNINTKNVKQNYITVQFTKERKANVSYLFMIFIIKMILLYKIKPIPIAKQQIW